jgi:putative ABC transport system permease protein
MRELDPRLPAAEAVTLGEALDEIGRGTSQIASGAGVMGIIALLLATLGLSAVLSFVVEQRRYEIGVRVALGAQSSAVMCLIVRQSLGLAALGIVVGALIAAAAATTMRGILFGLPPIDPIAFAGSTMLLFVVALLASAGPARGDPLVALRAE